MEQIYYTQCPIGYGLGASNGFQIKRIGAGYPPTGDVRHLAFRAFLPGSNGKLLAPGTLRYRRVGPIAEVAWLEPRAREYETERGLWGRPGGHFAHGLRLEPREFESIACWPAGLYGQPCWRRSDPEPSRGRRPDALTIGPADLLAPPDFSHAAPLVDLDADALAALLAMLADAARTGRTLFLLDEPDRLGRRIAALTFAFPEVLRPELTFSTYHDRPEELSGFRIQGVPPATAAQRASLAGFGPIADLTADRVEPLGPLPIWARTLAGWLVDRTPRDAEEWALTDDRARRARRPESPADLWSDAWLDGLVGLASMARGPSRHPTSDDDWRAFGRQVAWSSRAGLIGDLAEGHGPAWWRPIARDAGLDPSARDAFWTLVLSPETWAAAPAEAASDWGAIAARFWIREPAVHREQRLGSIVRRLTPADRLARFLDGMLRSIPAEHGRAALAWIERRTEADPRALLPLRARNAVGVVVERGSGDPLAEVLGQALPSGELLAAVLDLIADEAGRRKATAEVSVVVAVRIERAGVEARGRFESWALRRLARGGDDWLAPALRRTFGAEDGRADWDALRDRTDPALRPVLIDACLEAAAGPDAAPEAFLWAVEDLLLVAGADPRGARWVEPYLARVASPVDLADRLRRRGAGLAEWLSSARAGSGLRPESSAMIDDAWAIVRLISGQDEPPTDAMLARLPTADRAPMLGLMIDRLAGGELDAAGPILRQCARCWADAFRGGASGLDLLAAPLAGLLLQFLPDPPRWIDSLDRMLRWLGVEPVSVEDPPSGLAARIVAETCGVAADRNSAWTLRSALIRDDRFYPALGEVLRRDLHGEPPRRAVDVCRRWARSLDMGTYTGRFFEVLLNVCGGPRLASVVPVYAGELWTLGPLPWWSGPPRAGGKSDLREAFATLIPMAPLADLRSRPYIEAWLFRTAPGRPFSSILDDPDAPLLPVFASEGDASAGSDPRDELPEPARDRWRCVLALTEFAWEGKSDAARWAELMRWRKAGGADGCPPIAALGPDDRLEFLAGLLLALDHPGDESHELEALARWAARDLGLSSRARILRCFDATEARGAAVPERSKRLARDLAHQVAMQVDE